MNNSNEHGETDFSSALTDLMASLAVVFLLVAVCVILAMRAPEAEHKITISDIRDKILIDIREVLGLKDSSSNDCYTLDTSDIYKIRIQFREPSAVSIACSGLVFESGKFEITGSAENAAKKIAEIYVKLNEYKADIEDIRLQGHTDRMPYNSDNAKTSCIGKAANSDCGNLYLSAQRAREVFLFIKQNHQANDPEAMNELFSKTEISGRGSSRLLPGIDDYSSANRRVELIVDFNQRPDNTGH